MAKNAKNFEERPWGSFEVIKEFEVENGYADFPGREVVIKKITVKPGQMLSYQSHRKRRETWFVAQGQGKVIKDDEEILVGKGSVVSIKENAKHRIGNISEKINLIFIEISEGEFDENDITRYSDDYGRAKK
jgi:mannose-6-phosphate isomerase-like protein (cupin superfamily)